MTLEGFIDFIKDYAKQDVKSVIIGLRSCGFDICMERVYPADHHSLLEMSWSFQQDEALVKYDNILSAKLNCSAMKISPLTMLSWYHSMSLLKTIYYHL